MEGLKNLPVILFFETLNAILYQGEHSELLTMVKLILLGAQQEMIQFLNGIDQLQIDRDIRIKVFPFYLQTIGLLEMLYMLALFLLQMVRST